MILIFNILTSFILSFAVVTTPGFAQNGLDEWLGKPTEYNKVSVVDVVSTDTIKIDGPKGKEKIKLIGLYCPDTDKYKKERRKDVEYDQHGFRIEKPVDPLENINDKPLEFVRELLLDKTVRLEFDVDRSESDGTTSAYVFLTKDGTFANEEILRQGYADLQIRPPNTKYEDKLRAAYQEAREEKRGLQSN